MNLHGGKGVLGLCLLTLTACGTVESAIVGSAIRLAGDEGLSYIRAGEVHKIFYREFGELERVVPESFSDLSFLLEKKERYADGTLRYLGRIAKGSTINVHVKLRSLVKGVTEVTVTARDSFYRPEQEVGYLLMRQIIMGVGKVIHTGGPTQTNLDIEQKSY